MADLREEEPTPEQRGGGLVVNRMGLMNGWRDHILEHFTPRISRLTLVADPDGLLAEEGILNTIRDLGFDIIPFDDPIAFRFAYEAQYRQRWDLGEDTELVVVLRAEEDDLRSLPYDLLQAGRRLPTFRLATIFPKLSNPVVQALDRLLLDRLYEAYLDYDGDELGDRGTKDFILAKVFKLAPDLVATPPELLSLLCEKHMRADRFPAILDDRLIEVLGAKSAFAAWPLDRLVRDRDAFLRFLQERWPKFLEHLVAPGSAAMEPPVVPFDDPRVYTYVDTLFLDGLMKPVPFDHPEKLPEWARVGVLIDQAANARNRLVTLIGRLESSIPSKDATYREWQQLAWRWAEVLVLRTETSGNLDLEMIERIEALHERVERAFADWMISRFGSLASLVERDGRPIMVHHIVRYLAQCRTATDRSRLAMIVVDGLAMDQWLVIREELERLAPSLRMEETAVFAWVPTLTSVSRQSIFAGQAPLMFAESLSTTSKEKHHWQRVWEESGVPSFSIGYQKNLGNPGGADVDSLIEHPKMQVLGMVINTIDDIMHGMVLGTVGMHDNVRRWAEQGYLARLIERLIGAGFAVFLTSDHGNIEAVGQGRPQEGVLADMRGERARIYDNDLLRERVHRDFPDTVVWPGWGLPPNWRALLAAGLGAFVSKGERLVVHGGVGLEEVMVPFVRFWKE